MKKSLSLLFLLPLLLTACLERSTEPEQANDVSVETATEEAEMVTLSTVTDGAFTFVHKSQGENYYVDVVYKDQTIGQFFKELPVDGWDVAVFRQTTQYAYLGLEATGLGGYIPFGGPTEMVRVNLETGTFERLTFSGHVSDVAVDDSKLVTFSDVLPAIQVMDLSQALYPNGSNVKSFTAGDEFSYAGEAMFSPDGTKLAYVALEGPENERSRIYVVDLASGTQTEFLTQVGQVKLTGWNGAEPTYE